MVGPRRVDLERIVSVAPSTSFVVVVSKLRRETGAGLSPRSAHRAGCAARLFPYVHTCYMAHATMCYGLRIEWQSAHGDTVRVA